MKIPDARCQGYDSKYKFKSQKKEISDIAQCLNYSAHFLNLYDIYAYVTTDIITLFGKIEKIFVLSSSMGSFNGLFKNLLGNMLT